MASKRILKELKDPPNFLQRRLPGLSDWKRKYVSLMTDALSLKKESYKNTTEVAFIIARLIQEIPTRVFRSTICGGRFWGLPGRLFVAGGFGVYPEATDKVFQVALESTLDYVSSMRIQCRKQEYFRDLEKIQCRKQEYFRDLEKNLFQVALESTLDYVSSMRIQCRKQEYFRDLEKNLFQVALESTLDYVSSMNTFAIWKKNLVRGFNAVNKNTFAIWKKT